MTHPPDILKKILARKKEEVAQRRRRLPLMSLQEQAAGAPPARGFYQALNNRVRGGQAAVIAEIKKASPSKGVIREDFQPLQIAHRYALGGATCLSVLTDREFFQGSEAYLQLIREASSLPILRKDFTIDPYQVFETRALGADCILLIAAALENNLLRELAALATELHMDVLVEVHDAEELDRALALNLPLLGINNRNLRTFETALQTTLDLHKRVPPDRLVVSESGIRTPQDVALLRDNGVHAFLVGEIFMQAEDPGEQLKALFDL